jgi:diaminopimelate epimerase
MKRTGADAVEIAVGERVHAARLAGEGLVSTDVGRPEVGRPESIDVDGETLDVTPVSVGNPHAVVARDEPTRDDILRLGPLVERHPRFPRRTNVQLVAARDRRTIEALVWERGAGETTASGSSALAVAAAAIANGWCESPVTVELPGGALRVELEDGLARLTGPAEPIATGELS